MRHNDVVYLLYLVLVTGAQSSFIIPGASLVYFQLYMSFWHTLIESIVKLEAYLWGHSSNLESGIQQNLIPTFIQSLLFDLTFFLPGLEVISLVIPIQYFNMFGLLKTSTQNLL